VVGDGSGLDVLQTLRQQGAKTPALVLTGHRDAGRINRARALNAEFLCKPAEDESLESFARRAIALHWTRSERVARRIDAFAVEHRLTPRESELVAAAVAGMPRRLVAEELCVSENTLKAQIRLLLVKCDTPDLDDLSNEILKQALEGAALSRFARGAE
jgi:FixJ family two-component response regulator